MLWSALLTVALVSALAWRQFEQSRLAKGRGMDVIQAAPEVKPMTQKVATEPAAPPYAKDARAVASINQNGVSTALAALEQARFADLRVVSIDIDAMQGIVDVEVTANAHGVLLQWVNSLNRVAGIQWTLVRAQAQPNAQGIGAAVRGTFVVVQAP